MAGYNAVISLRRLEEELDKLGFMLCASKHGAWGKEEWGDTAGVRPKDENALPIYVRDAEVYTGTLEQIRVWLEGVKWARNYDGMLGVSNEKKREKKEDDYRHKELMRKLKQEPKSEETNK